MLLESKSITKKEAEKIFDDLKNSYDNVEPPYQIEESYDNYYLNDSETARRTFSVSSNQNLGGNKMVLRLKLEMLDEIKEDIWENVYIEEEKNVKLTSTNPFIEKDKKNDLIIKTIKNTKIIYKLESGGCLILIGNLGCHFKHPFGGQFFVKKYFIDKELVFEEVNGYDATLLFDNSLPMSIEATQVRLAELMQSSKFVFNVSQFNQFMEIFKYYKTISEELNNTATFNINYCSDPYHFVSVNEKNLYDNEGELLVRFKALEEVKDSEGIIIGYKVDNSLYSIMENDIKDKAKTLVELVIDNEENAFKKIKKMRENIYYSDIYNVNEINSKGLKLAEVLTVIEAKKEIILLIESDFKIDYKFLNLYDMGQKIKIESIDNSLKLINQGATSKAIELIEYLIGDKPMPSKTPKIASIRKQKYMKGLNDSQKEAFLKSIDDSPVTLIKGPPGTGKTHVINAITQYITKELKEKVVISSQTHVAIDNVLDKLMQNNDLVIPNRITNRRNKYSGDEIDKTLYKTWATKFNEHNANVENKLLADKMSKSLKNFKGNEIIAYSQNMSISDYSVIGATTTTSAIGGKKGAELLRDYKWLIIDEVSKCPITEVLRYLPYIEKIIMVGDDYQLAPLLEFNKDDVKDLESYDEQKFEELEAIYKKSVFADTIKKAQKAGRLIVLNENYRSVEKVLSAYNIFYDNKLISRRIEVNPYKTEISIEMGALAQTDAIFVDVKGGKEVFDSKSHSRYNVEELEATSYMLTDLIKYTKNPTHVTVSAIFPYAAQISKFTKEYKELINKAKRIFKSFEVDTVDAFQGKESDIVLVNTVVTTPNRNFLNDFRRINVSMSRAKDKLIVFGNSIVLSKIDMKVNDGSDRKFFKDIIENIKKSKGMTEFDATKGGINYETTSNSKIKLA